MPTTCQCPRCQRLLAAPDELLGHEVQCPSCEHVFVARASGQTSAPPASPPSPYAGASARDLEQKGERRAPPDWEHERYSPDDEDEYDDRWERRPQGELPGRGKAVVATTFLILSIPVSILNIGFAIYLFTQANIFARGGPGQQAALDLLKGTPACFYLLIILSSGIAFLIWIYRAYKNLDLLDVHGLQHSPGWAVGWYFVPIANLFKPYQVMQEMWKASNPDVSSEERRGYGWRDTAGSSLVGWWWACWLIQGIIRNFSDLSRFDRGPGRAGFPNVDLIRTESVLTIIGELFIIAAALCLITLIQKIQKRETEKYERLVSGVEENW